MISKSRTSLSYKALSPRLKNRRKNLKKAWNSVINPAYASKKLWKRKPTKFNLETRCYPSPAKRVQLLTLRLVNQAYIKARAWSVESCLQTLKTSTGSKKQTSSRKKGTLTASASLKRDLLPNPRRTLSLISGKQCLMLTTTISFWPTRE